MSKFSDWKASVLGKTLDVDASSGAQCVDTVKSWFEYATGVSWKTANLWGNAKDLFTNANSAYFDKIVNDHNNPNQVPQQGDIMVFAASPESGYASTYQNPYGHTAVVDGASSDGLVLIQQDSSENQPVVRQKNRAWRYTRCIGWLRIKSLPAATAPMSTGILSTTLVGHRVNLSPSVSDWRVYKPGTHIVAGHLDPMHEPAARSYVIRGIDSLPGRVMIHSGLFGNVALPVDGDATIN